MHTATALDLDLGALPELVPLDSLEMARVDGGGWFGDFVGGMADGFLFGCYLVFAGWALAHS